jgi:hypothetical protein
MAGRSGERVDVMSIWIREIDTALKLRAESIVKVYNADKVLTAVRVGIRAPETEEVIEDFPLVEIFHYDEKPSRPQQQGKFAIAVDEERQELTIGEALDNWDLFYQLDLCAKYLEDIDEMTRRWVGATGKHFNLDVIDTEGNPQICPVSLIDQRNLDEVGDKRLFRRVYSYRVWAQLDERGATTQPFPRAEIRKVEE